MKPLKDKLTPDEQQRMVEWAKRALKGLDESFVFVGVFNDQPLDAARIEFTLQLGHALLMGKPIILPVPHGVEIPERLKAAATKVVYYDPNHLESIQDVLIPVLTELGIKTQ